MKALLVKSDGLIYAAEVPEEPNQPEHPWDVSAWNEYHKYHAFLRVAKDSAVLVSDQEKVLHLLWQNDERIHSPIPFLYWKENMLKPGIYPIPDLQWEVQYGCGKCGAYYSTTPIPCENSYCEKRKVAILKTRKPGGAIAGNI